MKRIDRKNYFEAMDTVRHPHQDEYYAMYSSVFGGITTDPTLMQIPVDDHVVHRGDGVFETFKCVNWGIYNLSAHLDRFHKSASLLAFQMAAKPDGIEEIIVKTAEAAGRKDASIRLMLSRGPGSFSVNPYDCVGPQLYVIVSELKQGFMELHPEGATLGVSRVSAKLSFFARVKNCNYLPNVLMKKESVDLGYDYVAGFDSRGMLTEGACENIGVVTAKGDLAFPLLDGILCGTTMMRAAELATEHREELGLGDVAFRDIPETDMRSASEILIVGTTPNVASVREFDGKPVGDGAPGPVGNLLNDLLVADILSNKELRTDIHPSG